MNALGRWAGYLAMAGGALLVVLTGVIAYDPETAAWFAFFAVVALLGAAVVGLEGRTRTATGRLGRASAWISSFGAVGLLGGVVYALATNQMSTDGSGTSDPLAALWMVTGLAWFLGNLGFAVAIIRARALSVTGGWLVLAGAVAGVATTLVLGEDVPTPVLLLFGLFGVGWIVVGYAGARPPGRAV